MVSYWTKKEDWDSLQIDEGLAYGLSQMPFKTLLDIGCGNGGYVQYLRGQGRSAWGYDANPMTDEWSYGMCGVADFSKIQRIGTFDIVLSVGLGEHIDKQFEGIYLDNLCRHAEKSVILSWSDEIKKGHINPKSQSYIIEQMKCRGMVFDEKKTLTLRDKCHIYKDIMIFR